MGQTKQQKLSFSLSAMVLDAREVRRLAVEYCGRHALPINSRIASVQKAYQQNPREHQQ